LNLAITMLLGGLWHGASWTFVIWGALHGACILVHRLWVHLRRRAGLDRSFGVAGLWTARLVTFTFVTVLWVIFRAPSVGAAGTFLGSLARIGVPDGGGAFRVTTVAVAAVGS
jgi:D-alanyl-lipoteichoic acid acyltransferase DltB (MBOAT superfamily)